MLSTDAGTVHTLIVSEQLGSRVEHDIRALSQLAPFP